MVLSNNQRSWMLETEEEGIKTVLSMLKPEGVVFQAAIKFMSNAQVVVSFPVSLLPVQTGLMLL